ncbi:MAG: acylphosphatase [Phycisphaerales bacterium]|nr:acylphosphatase [Phycisphaerales bacterium]
MSTERHTILFTGHVQGVGFRMTAAALARGLPLAGTVRNTPDHNVELIVEGPPEQIDLLVTRLREHFGSFIRSINQTSSPPTNALSPGIHITH